MTLILATSFNQKGTSSWKSLYFVERIATLISRSKLKLADLGLSKWVSDDHSSYTFSSDAGPVGAGGWYAKEILLEERKTRKVDIFSLGVVIHYTLTHGVNPFGDKYV